MNEKDISSNKEEDLSTNGNSDIASASISETDVASNDTSGASATSDNATSERPRHDALIRKALENPIVAKEFFEMHLPKEIQAMFSSHTLKMEKESFVEVDLKHSISDILLSLSN